MTTVNLGLVGIGNCASSLVQGVQYYGRTERVTTGLTNPVCAGFGIADVRITSAFDVNARKLGMDVAQAIWVSPNNAFKFADVSDMGVVVREGILEDGIGKGLQEVIRTRGTASVGAIGQHLRDTDTHVLVNFLPVGSQAASEAYANAALAAGCAYINCIPTTVARSSEWAGRFERAGLPLVGDDLKSQFGSTLLHHALLATLQENGVQVSKTYQIVCGGNMDFLNLQDIDRIGSKRVSKVLGMGGGPLASENVHFGAEYVPFLKDRKTAFIRIEGDGFGTTPVEVELRMSVEDSPSAAGNVLDAVRHVRRAMLRGRGGVIHCVSALFMKAAPVSMSEAAAKAELADLIGC